MKVHAPAATRLRDRAERDSGQQSATRSALEDHRPQTTAQLALAQMADGSERVESLKTFTGLMNASPRAVAQRRAAEAITAPRRAVNATGLPDQLKSGIEALSGMPMDGVTVHYNSAKPAQLNAHAYAQGSDIYLASGQERHLPHEAWHVVQQARHQVPPTRQLAGVSINDNDQLETEATVMGARAMRGPLAAASQPGRPCSASAPLTTQAVFTEEAGPADKDRLSRLWQALMRLKPALAGLDREFDAKLNSSGNEGAFMEWTMAKLGAAFLSHEVQAIFAEHRGASAPVAPGAARMEAAEEKQDAPSAAAASPASRRHAPAKASAPPAKLARVGFEFQMLKSRVNVNKMPDPIDGAQEESDSDSDDGGFHFDRSADEKPDYAALLAKVTHTPALSHYPALWSVVDDGGNLEFVTAPFKSVKEMEACMHELTAVAHSIAALEVFPAFFKLGDTVVEVLKSDAGAQPQVNPDMALDDLPAFARFVAGDQETQDQLFGVDGVFHWHKAQTMQELARGAVAAEAILGIDKQQMITLFKVTGNQEDVDEKLATIQGMLLVMTQAAIHIAEFPTQLTKDLPILLKTSMSRTWASLVNGHVVGGKPSVKDVVGMVGTAVAGLDGKTLKNVIGHVFAGTDPVWGSLEAPNDLPRPSERPKAKPNRKQIFIELRRVPVLPIGQWLEFTRKAFTTFHGTV